MLQNSALVTHAVWQRNSCNWDSFSKLFFFQSYSPSKGDFFFPTGILNIHSHLPQVETFLTLARQIAVMSPTTQREVSEEAPAQRLQNQTLGRGGWQQL